MEQLPELKLSEFSKALMPGRLFTFRVIGIALVVGVTLFLGIVVVLYFQNKPGPETVSQVTADGILPILSMVHGVMAVSGYVIAFFVNRMLLSARSFMTAYPAMKVNLPPEQDTPESRYFVRLFTAYIIPMAILEGVTLFGLIICMLGVLEGEIYDKPIYWLNLFSYAVFVCVFLWTFPTKSKLEAVFKKRFMKADDDILKA